MVEETEELEEVEVTDDPADSPQTLVAVQLMPLGLRLFWAQLDTVDFEFSHKAMAWLSVTLTGVRRLIPQKARRERVKRAPDIRLLG